MLHDVMTHAFFILDGKSAWNMSIAMVHSNIEREWEINVDLFHLFYLSKRWSLFT